jgi:hypothetical protein
MNLGVLEYKDHHYVLTNDKSQVDFDCLCEIHVIDRIKENISYGLVTY